MSSNKAHVRRRGRGAMRGLGLALPVLSVFALLLSFQVVNAVSITTGTTATIGNVLDQGVTSYVVYYSYPSVAQVGTNLTIDLSLHLNQFAGQVEYINGYTMKVQVFVGSSVLQASVFGPPGFNFLYPGSTWGPENLTLPLTQADTGLSPGTSANATLGVIVSDTVYYGVPENGYETEPPMQAQAGSLIIENAVNSNTTTTSTSTQGGGPTLVPYALLASGAVLVAVAVFLPRGPRSPQAAQS